MNRMLIYAATFALAMSATSFANASIISVGYATANTDDKVPNLDNSLQLPPIQWRLVKHSFRLHIPRNNKALSQLIIDAPPTVAVSNDIEVLDENGREININISVNGRKIIIHFPETVINNTQLNINLNKVKQPIQGSASIYKLLVKVVGSDIEIPVGVAQFTTF
ncbi:DUF2808 domain-containing protein [Fischerella thermalis CCMEE 5273]|nr:DUF2808 domain-containing protein [Chlorogloeopsis fritschii]PMB09468.1 DUF2808 domain-containing protein [Fischerella thermalis CCMEE 5273]PMB50412.1 DUF2808 domain-containing protein [Fischerella thermalis CCMEE 5205]